MASAEMAEPSELRSAGQTERLDGVPSVEIDAGVFKYVLIKVSDGDSWKLIVRGYDWASYHADIFDRVSSGIRGLGLDAEVLGGGRIQHMPDIGRVFVYGYSMAYGRAKHAVVTALVKEAHPDYRDITWSNEGY